MEGGVRCENLAKMIPKSRSLLDVTLCPAAIWCPDRVIDTWGRLKPLVAFQREVSSGERDVMYFSKVAFWVSLKAACKFLFKRL
jgi:hypothetical protein